MSSETVRGIVVSHGALGAALVDAVQAITGQADLLIPITNDGCSAASLLDRVRAETGLPVITEVLKQQRKGLGTQPVKFPERLGHIRSRVIPGVKLIDQRVN